MYQASTMIPLGFLISSAWGFRQPAANCRAERQAIPSHARVVWSLYFHQQTLNYTVLRQFR
jgi:hypothetical protein